MGTVFEAFDPVIQRRVAIKTLRLEIFDESQLADVRTRFIREAQSAGQMAHPHIVTVYDYGEHEGTPYIVMEFLAGSELSKVLERGTRLPLSEVVRLMTQLLGALAYAHQRKVVHRDIKPGNIFVLDDGSLKVVDFGLARVEASNLTDTGAILGTPAYMSPEQFLALPVDERSDIFSAGVILYELLTGDKPFTGSFTTVMQKVLHQVQIEPSRLNPLLSNGWDAVINRAMAKKPEARFHSARQFSETIKQVFDSGALHVSIEATLPGNSNAVAPTANAPRPEPVVKPETRVQQPIPVQSKTQNEPAPKRRRWALAIAGVLLVVGIGFFGSSLWRTQIDNTAQEKAVAEQAASQKKAAESAAQEKAAAEKAAAVRAAAERVAIEKGVTERLVQIKAVQDKELAEQAAMLKKKAAQEKAAADKLAQEKAIAEKATQERVTAEKAAAAKAASSSVERRQLPPCAGSYNTTWTNCIGTSTLPNGDKYVGEYRDLKMNGQGTVTFASGAKYVGEWKDDEFNGQGTYTFANGRIQSGTWADGKFVGSR